MLKKVIRISAKIILSLLIIMVVSALIYASPWLWRKFWVYPKLEKERSELRLKYIEPTQYIKQTDYKGVLHAHSYWSHDSRGVIEEILPAAKKAELDFLFLSDHTRSKMDSFPRGYAGVYDGIIIEPGTENQGLMVTPLKKDIIDWSQPKSHIIRNVVDAGGLVLYVHTEEKHQWNNPDYQAMEIYNIHTDLIDEEDGIMPFVLNAAINGKKYGHWAIREIYDDQTVIMKRWDSINKFQRIVGMAASDAHNNNNIRARYNKEGLVEWIGPNADLLATVKPGWKEKLLLSEPDEIGWAFKFETDTYFLSFNYVNTHVFCDTLSNINIKDNLIAGHAFIAFENLANAKGFQYFSTDSNENVNAILGDSISVKSVGKLQAISPFPVQFKLIKDGVVVDTIDDKYSYEFNPEGKPGNYRLEARLKFKKDKLLWVIANPIYLY